MISVRELVGLVALVAIVNAIGTAPSLVVGMETAWFDEPWFYPPDYLFGIVWTVLFTLKAVALFLILRTGFARPAVRRGVAIFAGQFALSLLWTPVFFDLRRPDIAFLVIIGLVIAIVAMIRSFGYIDIRAAVLLIPYLLWTLFAMILNAVIAFG